MPQYTRSMLQWKRLEGCHGVYANNREGASASISSHQQHVAHSMLADVSRRRQCMLQYRGAAKVFAALPCASCRMSWLSGKQLPRMPGAHATMSSIIEQKAFA